MFSLHDIEFGVKRLAKWKGNDIERCQLEILKFGGYIFIPHIHKLFNIVIKERFSKHWTKSLIAPIFRNYDKIAPQFTKKLRLVFF
jgi:hypothetical protein